MSRWIVMESRSRMPDYNIVALVKLTEEYANEGRLPKKISQRSRGIEQLHRLGTYHVGKTDQSSYAIVLAEAARRAAELNQCAPEAEADVIKGWNRIIEPMSEWRQFLRELQQREK